MRAVYLNKFGGPEVLEVGDLSLPVLRATEVRVKIRWAALNHLDIWVRRGLPHSKLPLPHVPCADGSGVIDAVGAEVTQFRPGDEAIVYPGVSCGKCERCLNAEESLCRNYSILGENRWGTAAEFVTVPEANLFLKPPEISFEVAAAIPLVFTTAWQMLTRRTQIIPGEVVLVHGAGSGVGMAGIQIAKLFGATVIATAGSDEKLQVAKTLGADEIINYRRESFSDWVKKYTQKKGVDLIFDHLGQEYWDQNIKSLRWGGRLVMCGATTGFETKLDLRQIFFRQISLIGSTMGSKADFPRLISLVARGKLRPVMDRVFPFSEVQDAYRRLENREQCGKVLLRVGGGD